MPQSPEPPAEGEVPDVRAGRRAERVPMTVDEAERIEEQAASGALDPRDPGVRRLIEEAHRTSVQAYLWGTTDGRPERRSRRRLFLFVSGAALLTIAGLILSFLMASR